ncbi:3TM-type holin [Novosphingobium sp. 9U]|uniref:3TM-type holin n=1 Tax=Novosphingobium sp. 9U TaxID=2653158 RepID=UPI0012F043E7|nr:3TM-type holin [Novosphingobium sp. 9U]VWX51890.1 hypothetical protein NOVOSPHI9U_40463 [Novosphingobium sp. 9U]
MSYIHRLLGTARRCAQCRAITSLAALNEPAPVQAVSADRQAPETYAARARPTFLYVMYAMILWSVPIGLVAAVSPGTARQIADGMTRYLAALPEPLYALFGTGYLGYATLRQWGKSKGLER